MARISIRVSDTLKKACDTAGPERVRQVLSDTLLSDADNAVSDTPKLKKVSDKSSKKRQTTPLEEVSDMKESLVSDSEITVSDTFVPPDMSLEVSDIDASERLPNNVRPLASDKETIAEAVARIASEKKALQELPQGLKQFIKP